MYLFKEMSIDLPDSQLIVNWEFEDGICVVEYIYQKAQQWISANKRTMSYKEGLRSIREWRKIRDS